MQLAAARGARVIALARGLPRRLTQAPRSSTGPPLRVRGDGAVRGGHLRGAERRHLTTGESRSPRLTA